MPPRRAGGLPGATLLCSQPHEEYPQQSAPKTALFVYMGRLPGNKTYKTDEQFFVEVTFSQTGNLVSSHLS